jgi:uncharacterized protein (DUF849 family)
MFSDGFTFGYPPRAYALESYVELMNDLKVDASWMIGGLQVDILPLIAPALRLGGHVRVGLEDAPFGSNWTNMQWTEAAISRISEAGGTLAPIAEVRQLSRF